MKKSTFTNLCLIILFLSISCSKSRRAMVIEMARKEASKKETKPEPNTIIKNKKPEIVKIDDVVTPKEKTIIKEVLVKNKIPPAEGDLIQVEGLVVKEVSELIIKLQASSSQLEQIIKMKNYVFDNWHYIFDPNKGGDTWRSAEATLSLKYKGQYSGDCDDYAILMASFAKQIGLTARVIGGYSGDSGHAFAEFLIDQDMMNNKYLRESDIRQDNLGRMWVSLDWFRGNEHRKFTINTKVLLGN